MQLSPPTVHEMVGRLEQDGYVDAQRRQVARVHRRRARAGRGDRQPPPADRALPDRRRRASPGTTFTRRPSASSTRCHPPSRPTWCARSATRRPARTATRSSPATRVPACRWPTSRSGAEARGAALRERGRGPAALPQARPGSHPGLKGTLAAERRRRGRDRAGGESINVTRSVAETVSVIGRPLTAAAHRAPRPARARQGALRPLAGSRLLCSRRRTCRAEAPCSRSTPRPARA